MNTTGSRIKDKRQELHLTVRQLAALCNINPASLSKIENDLQCPNRDTLIKLAKHLQTSIDFLCGLTNDSTPASLNIRLGDPSAPASSIKRAIDNYYVTDNSISSFLQDEIVYILAHIDNLKRSGKYDPVGDVDIARSLSKVKGGSEPQDIGKSELTKKYEELNALLFSKCDTHTGNHIENISNVIEFLKNNFDKIDIH